MHDEILTDRLILRRPTVADLDAIHRIYSDPRVWEHYPSLRHSERPATERLIARWIRGWDVAGLASWIVSLRGTGEIVGNGGCTLIGDGDAAVWNLGYRISADHHGRGFATETSRAAVDAAGLLRPATPVVAFMVEHNRASAVVAEKVGLALVHRGPDAGNPDPGVIRLVYSDRPLTDAQRATILG